MQPIIVTTSCERKKDAERIAKMVLNKRFAACVQISSPVTSSYWWKETIASDTEYLVNMKSKLSLFKELSQNIKQIHPYDTPEIIATELIAVDDEYLAWLSGEVITNEP